MALIIDGINFNEMENQKYWSFPKSYKKDSKTETKNMIFSGDYIGARKIDGAFYKFIKDFDGNKYLLGRNKNVDGIFLNKIDWVPQLNSFFDKLPNGTCLLGELYFIGDEGSSKVTTIMGCLKDKAITRQEKGKKLNYYIFDVLAYGGVSMVKSNVEYRILQLDAIKRNYSNPCIQFADYYEGEKLWNILEQIFENGGEGIVITKKGTCYQPGKRPARQTLKIKKEISETIDVFVINGIKPTKEYTGKEIESWKYWENEMTGNKIEGTLYKEYSEGAPLTPVTKNYFYEWAGSLEIGVVKEDKVVTIGAISGLTEEILSNYKNYRGKVMEITCMEVLPTKGLRHPKFIKWRPDLVMRDCTWEKIYNE